MAIDINSVPFVKIYGPEGMKSNDELYDPIRELVRRLVSNNVAITYSGSKGVSQFVANSAKEFGTKGAPFDNIVCHIFVSMDIKSMQELFEVLNKIEKDPNNTSKIILFDEPGWSIWERLNIVLTELMDRRRVGGWIFDRVVSTWSLNEIMDFVKVGIDRFGKK